MKHPEDPWPGPNTTPEAAPLAPPAAASAVGRDVDPWAVPGQSSGNAGITAPEQRNSAAGICYLLHFSEPYKHARHYSGTAAGLAARLAEHQAGRGSRLLQVVKAAGITWTLARTWPGGRQRERQLKNQGGASRRCPECGVTPRSNPGERKETAAMKQPPEKDAAHAQGIKTPPGHGATTWASAQLRDQIQRSGAAPRTGQPTSMQVREADGAPRADLEAEPARTARHHGKEPPTGQQITGIAGRAEAAARRADEHALAARSVDCECQAQAGTSCGPSGDHLARYLRAARAGTLTKDSLKEIIAGLDVIAPRALIQPLSERGAAAGEAGKTTGQTVPRRLDTGMAADRAGAPAQRAPSGRSSAAALEGEALGRGYRAAAAIDARKERELEAGS